MAFCWKILWQDSHGISKSACPHTQIQCICFLTLVLLTVWWTYLRSNLWNHFSLEFIQLESTYNRSIEYLMVDLNISAHFIYSNRDNFTFVSSFSRDVFLLPGTKQSKEHYSTYARRIISGGNPSLTRKSNLKTSSMMTLTF